MRKLLLQPEWRWTPLRIDRSDNNDWSDFFEDITNDSWAGVTIPPENLPLSQKLIDEIWDWAEVYDTFLNWDDPRIPVEIDPEIEAAFWAQGEELVKKIQHELGSDYSVTAGWQSPSTTM